MKKMMLAILILTMILPLSSCYDAKELDNWAYVYTVGIDKGQSSNLHITFQVASLKQEGESGTGRGQSGTPGQGNGGTQSGSYEDIAIDCTSMINGVNYINTSLSRTVNLTQIKYIVFSEDFAKGDLGYWVDALARFSQIRRNAYVVITKGTAENFVKAFNPVLGTALAKTQEGQIEQLKINGLAYTTNLFEFVNDLKSTKVQPHAMLAAVNQSVNQQSTSSQGSVNTFEGYTAGELPRSGGNQIEFFGTALFDSGKMVDTLDGNESQIVTMITGNFEHASFTMNNPIDKKYNVVIRVQPQKKPDIRITIDKGKPVIRQTISLEGDIQAVQGEEALDDQKLFPMLQNEFISELKKEINQTIGKCQKDNCDVFGYGNLASEQFPTIQSWTSYNWLGRFKDAAVYTTVEFTVRRNGTELRNSPVQQTEGNQP